MPEPNDIRLLELNSSDPSTLKSLFKQVCHSDAWAEAMSQSGPFTDLEDLLKKGEAQWSKCGEADWRQAIDGHPRIGEKQEGKSLAAQWSKGEQSQATAPEGTTMEKLKNVQDQYYEKFGFIFLICATGKSKSEILSAAEIRLGNNETEELKNVAQEQGQIIQLRLEKLLKS